MRGLSILLVSFLSISLVVFSNPFMVQASVQEDPLVISSIEVSPDTSNSPADYRINLKINSGGGLVQGAQIAVTFPSCVTLPESISNNDVSVYGSHPTGVVVYSSIHTVVFYSPVDVSNGEFYIEFSANADIKNPTVSEESSYSLQVSFGDYSASGTFTIEPGSSSDCTVHVYPNQTGVNASYTIKFMNHIILQSGDYIDIEFSNLVSLPESIPGGKFTLNGHLLYGVQKLTASKIRIPISSSFMVSSDEVSIDIPSDVGIRNPIEPGNYYIKLKTSKMSEPLISNTYTIVGTSISNLSVSVDPLFQGANVEFTIKFITSSSGELKAGDDIFITFPGGMGFPDSLDANKILLKANSSSGNPTSVQLINDRTLSISVPFYISPGTDVEIDISKGFGLINPLKTGEYSITVYTINDATKVSYAFNVITSTISNVGVALSNYSSGQVSGYKITFITGIGGSLTGGSDKIYIVFPLGTLLPDSIELGAIKVNGIPTNCSLDLSKRQISILVPSGINANSSVLVDIPESAAIKNPITTGSYVIKVSTNKETSWVSSAPYTMVSSPTTVITVIPSQPDGKNGYYITQPIVTFKSSSPVDANPFIYYYFNDNEPTQYVSPIKVPEGISILNYYAVDHQNNRENLKTKQFKFDDIPPELEVLSPKDGSVVSSKVVQIVGKTEANATLKVNGKPVNVLSNGNFSCSINLESDETKINIVSEDEAGNKTNKTIKIYLDTTPPVLTVKTPVMFQEIHRLPILVTGVTEKGATVTVNGNKATVDENGNFTYSILNINNKEGNLYAITVIARDAAGNESKKIINVKYIKTTTITLQIGNTKALVNTSVVTLKVSPIIRNNRTLVPLRFIGEAFGAEIDWDGIFQIIDIKMGSDKVRLQIGKKFGEINGKKIELDAAPIIYKDKTMVPIRFISEAFNADIHWDKDTKTIVIIYPKGG